MDIQRWMDGFTAAVRDAFGARVRCIGLQGSHARGEARADSDIDAVVILDEWRAADWDRYRVLLDGLPERSRVCGFVSGWAELLAWEPSELFGFYYDTKPWYGDLEALKTRFGPADARRAVRTGACGIYHACAHNRLHERDAALLEGLYRGIHPRRTRAAAPAGGGGRGHPRRRPGRRGRRSGHTKPAAARMGGRPDPDLHGISSFGSCMEWK